MTLFPNGGMDALITVKDKEYRKQFDKLPAVFPTDEGTIAFFESKDTLTTNQAKEESKDELLLLNQHASQEILPADRDDIAVNFIILPEFFDQTLSMLGSEPGLLRDFVVGCLQSLDSPVPFLHFKVAGVLPVQNLIENLVWTITNGIQNKRLMNQVTMGLLFLQLLNHMDKLETGTHSYEQEMLMNVFQYIEEHYKDGSLTALANQLNCEFTWLSKTVKNLTGSTYTQLVQKKRLNQACFLLRSTALSVLDISMAVGYDNFSYFHRIFKQETGMSPRTYRLNA